MLYNILLILGITAVIGETVLIILWFYARFSYRKEKTLDYTPKTCVIVPCRGKNKDLRENLEAICNQDYPDFKVIFVIDSQKDTAYTILEKIVRTRPNTKIELSDIIQSCSGKISALIKGVEKAGDAEVYVFADSDIKPHKEWLRYLVDRLKEDGVGATTGFRWYFPHNKTSSLISAWNMVSIVGLFYSISNYTWGGSTAIRKKVFDEIDVKSKWKNALSDDLTLTETLKNKKYKIKFVPQCIIESPADENIKKFIRWGSRQLTWMRWYYPSLWILSIIGFVGANVLTCSGFILPFIGFTLPGLLFISMIFLEMIFGYVGFTTVKKMMGYKKDRFGSAFYYALMMPAVFFLLAYNMFMSTFTHEIEWCGRTYKKSDVIKK